MVDKISKDQYHDLCQSSMWDNTDGFNRLLEQMTGIIPNGLQGGLIGAGIGAGASGTAVALRAIFRK